MDLDFDDGQTALGAVARDLFESRCPLTTVRALEDDPLGYQPELWVEMAGLDWLSLTYPESVGGSGAGVLDLATIYHQFGRTLAPSPHLPSAVVTGEVLSREPGLPRAELLAAMGRGETVVVPALVEADARFGAEAVGLPMVLDIDGYHLTGTKLLVPYATAADQLLVVARSTAPPDGITLVLIDRTAPGVTVEPMANTANLPLFAVALDDVVVSPEQIVGDVGHGWSLLGPSLDRAAVLRCAEIVGAGERLLEMAVDYALNRTQFGKPIGQFQAVQYLCTDIAIDTHLASLLMRQAAWRLDHGVPARREVSLAKAHASRAAERVAHRTHEVFAGVAFMLESDVQLYTRRLKHWEFDLGDARFHDDVVAAGLET